MSEEKQEQAMRAPPIEVVRTELTRMQEQFKMVLPPYVSVERFIRVAITAIQMDPELLNVSRASLFAELMKCAKDGLIPDGREAALTRYRTKAGPVAQYMPMVGGILKKVRNSGELVNMHPDIVHENDQFKFWIDDNGPHLMHEPNWKERGEPIAAYVITNTKNEGRYIDVLARAEIMAVKNASKAKEYGPWSGDFELEMWKKTAIRRQAKRLPSSTDLDDVIRRDDSLTDLAPAAPPAVKAESVAALEQASAPAPREVAKSLSRQRADGRPVYNEAPGAPDGPPKGDPSPEPAFDAATAPAPAKPQETQANPAVERGAPDRKVLGEQLMAGFKKMGWTAPEAAAWAEKKTGKSWKDTLAVEMSHLYDDLVELAMEKGVTL